MSRLLAIVALATLIAPVAGQASWATVYSQQFPSPRSSPFFVHHEGIGRTLLLFGFGAAGPLNEAWELQGTQWSQLPAPALPMRQEPAVAYDSLRQVVVVYGGFSPTTSQSLDDTWEWNGTTWTQRSVVNVPPPRQGAACAFDRLRGRVVMFGGFGVGNVKLQDTWEWDGFDWLLRGNLQVSPPGRGFARLAFDPVAGGVLLHGGVGGNAATNVALNDTWSFHGATWVQRFPQTPPPFRTGAGMVTDVGRQRVVLHGGSLSDPSSWEWNGAEWSPVANIGPGARFNVAMVYDAPRRRVVEHGGFIAPFGASVIVNDTWIYRTTQHANIAPFGAGCAGSFGVPSLAGAPFSLPWLGDLATTRVSNVPSQSFGVIFAVSFTSIAPIPLAGFGAPGCDLLVAPDVSAINIASGNIADWLLAIPNNPAVSGLVFRQQAFVLDFAANPLGLVASNAITLTTGVR